MNSEIRKAGRYGILVCFLLFGASATSQAATLNLTGTIRDFHADSFVPSTFAHPDFESTVVTDPGIVQATLGGDGKPVYTGVAGNPSTHGATAFNQWYNDTAGFNLSTPHTITLTNSTTTPAIYTFSDSTFFPIDGLLFGNEGRSHNFHFTYEIHSSFTYLGGETFSFTGDDDLFVFINNKLAIDLGGVHLPLTGIVNLNTAAGALGISTGNNYSFDLFFAERHTSQSNFRIDTSLLLGQEPPPPVGGVIPEPASMLLMGSGLFGAFLRKRIQKQVKSLI